MSLRHFSLSLSLSLRRTPLKHHIISFLQLSEFSPPEPHIHPFSVSMLGIIKEQQKLSEVRKRLAQSGQTEHWTVLTATPLNCSKSSDLVRLSNEGVNFSSRSSSRTAHGRRRRDAGVAQRCNGRGWNLDRSFAQIQAERAHAKNRAPV